MTTSATTATLMAVITAEKFDDSLVPSASSVATTAMMISAPQSKSSGPMATTPPENPKTVPRCQHRRAVRRTGAVRPF